MVTLYNKKTDLAESLPEEEARARLAEGTHELYFSSPEGQIVSGSPEKSSQLLSEGYKPPSQKEYKELLDYAKYESPEKGLKAFAQAAAKSFTGGSSTALQIAAGDTREEIEQVEKHHPGKTFLGEIVPFATPFGVPGLITKAGAGATRALGLGVEGAGYLNKLGSYAVRNYVEGALIQGTDEVSKAMAGTPGQTLGSAVSHMALTGLFAGGIGGAIGTAHPLWSSKNQKVLGEFLGAVKDRMNGVEKAIDPLIKTSGMDVSPVMKSVLEGNPTFKNWYQKMMHGDTIGAHQLQAESKEFVKEPAKAILQAINKDENFLNSIADLSVHDAGEAIKQSFEKRLLEKLEVVKASYDPIANRFKEIPIAETLGPYGQVIDSPLRDLEKKFGEIAEKRGLTNSPSSEGMKYINQKLPEIKLQNNLEKLRLFGSNIGRDTFSNPSLTYLGYELKDAIKQTSQHVLERFVGSESSELLTQLKASNAIYKELKDLTRVLNDQFKVGKHSGTKTFLDKFNNLTAEKIWDRVSPKNNAAFIEKLSTQFPHTSELVKDVYLNQALRHAKVEGDQLLSPKKFFDRIFGTDKQSWSPEIRDFVLNKEVAEGVSAEARLKAIQELVNRIPDNKNPSGSGGMGASLVKNWPAEVIAAISWLTGHNPASGYVLAKLARVLGTEAPDYAKVSLLKFFGSSAPVDSKAFQTMAHFVESAAKGQSKIINSSRDLFKAAPKVIISEGTESEYKKTEKHIEQFKNNPGSLLDSHENITHYLPELGVELGSLAATAADVYSSIKPHPSTNLFFDAEVKPSKEKVAAYERKLGLMNQPLRIYNYIKDHTLTDSDRDLVKKLYPGFYQRSSEAILNQVMAQKEKEQTIPYSLKLSISKYLQMPLDSSMTPQSGIMNQMTFGPGAPMTSNEKEQAQMQMKAPSLGGLKSLGKFANSNQTALQARQSRQVLKG